MEMPTEVVQLCHIQHPTKDLQKGTDHQHINLQQSLPTDKLRGLWRVKM